MSYIHHTYIIIHHTYITHTYITHTSYTHHTHHTYIIHTYIIHKYIHHTYITNTHMYACMHAVREMGREDKHRDRWTETEGYSCKCGSLFTSETALAYYFPIL